MPDLAPFAFLCHLLAPFETLRYLPLALVLFRRPAGYRTPGAPRREPGKALPLTAYLVLFALLVFFPARPDQVVSRIPGFDALTHAGMAREILQTDSLSWALRGFEHIYYFQPFFRYWQVALLAVFGDGDQGWVFWVTSLFIASSALASVPILMWAVRGNILEGLGDHLGWLFLWPGMLLLLWRRSTASSAWGSFLLGCAVISRLELMPGAVLFLAARLWSHPAVGF